MTLWQHILAFFDLYERDRSSPYDDWMRGEIDRIAGLLRVGRKIGFQITLKKPKGGSGDGVWFWSDDGRQAQGETLGREGSGATIRIVDGLTIGRLGQVIRHEALHAVLRCGYGIQGHRLALPGGVALETLLGYSGAAEWRALA